MGMYDFLLWNVPGMPEEEESIKRIFHYVPRRKRTAYTHTSTPKWIHRLKKDMKIVDDPILLLEKPLDLDDVNPTLNRLSVPIQLLDRNDFLTCCEWRILRDERMGVGAFLVDQRTKQWQMVLKKWVCMTDSETVFKGYLLSGEWSDLVEANGLRDDDNISLWCFRHNGYLFFALDFAGDAVDLLE